MIGHARWIVLALLLAGCASKAKVQEMAKAQNAANAAATVQAYYEALAAGDYERLSAVMQFDAEGERVLAQETLPATRRAISENLDLDRPVLFVSAPTGFRSGDYLFLIPLRQGYAPRRILLVNAGGQFLVRYLPSEFVRAAGPGANPFLRSPSREALAKELQRWQSARTTELIRLAQDRRRWVKEQIALLRFAEARKVEMCPESGTLSAWEEMQRQMDGLAPGEIQALVIADLQARLAQMPAESK